MTTINAPVPSRSLEQRLRALERANWTRSMRKELKRAIKAGRRQAVDVIASPPEYVSTMPVIDLLLVVPRYGRGKAGKVLRRADVSPSRTLGGLTPRQRDALVAALSELTSYQQRSRSAAR